MIHLPTDISDKTWEQAFVHSSFPSISDRTELIHHNTLTVMYLKKNTLSHVFDGLNVSSSIIRIESD